MLTNGRNLPETAWPVCYKNRDMGVPGRRNTFGPFHLTPMDPAWMGPVPFRSEGEQWSDAYQIIPVGRAESPSLLKA